MTMAIAEPDAKLGIEGTVATEARVFIDRCVATGVDIIVPIETEGMALLLPYLLEPSSKNCPTIIPDSALYAAAPRLSGKNVLVLDASAVTARKLNEVTRRVKRYAGKVTRAVFLLHRECPEKYRPEIVGNVLDSREYSWAKSELIRMFLDRPFPLDGDHLIFHFSYAPHYNYEDVLAVIRRIGGTYLVSDPGSRIIRVTLDNIKLERPPTILPEHCWLEGVCKVRFYFDPANQRFSVVPIVYPAVPISRISADTPCPYCAIADDLIGSASTHKHLTTSRECFRRVGLHAAAWLMHDLIRSVMAMLPNDMGLRLVPEPDVLRGCWCIAATSPDEIVERTYRFIEGAMVKFTPPSQPTLAFANDEAIFSFHHFVFDSLDHRDKGVIRNLVAPWHDVCVEFGDWFGNLKIRLGDSRKLERAGLTHSQICERMADRFEPTLISFCYDVLLDEGILRPRVVDLDGPPIDGKSLKYWARGYNLGGEHVRRRILVLAAAARHDRTWYARVKKVS